MGVVRIMSLVVVLAGALGCHRTLSAAVHQPNPLTQPLETLRESERITIVTGDMELELPTTTGATAQSGGSLLKNQRYPLNNAASFTVVSRDRVRFHIQIEHKWREWADVTTWNAYLVDDKGRVHRPADTDLVSDRHVVIMWDYETRSVRRNRYGDITQINDDGYKRRQTLGSLSLFRGNGDLVFYQRDLFTPDVKWLKLVLARPGMTFEFTWRFDDDGPGDGVVDHAVAKRVR